LAFLSSTPTQASQTNVPRTSNAIAGVWSFDGSCASGDGMALKADGKAGYDEWGAGLWALADKGTRIVLLVEDITEEADRRKVATLVEFKINNSAGDKMMLMRLSDGAKVNAVKCKPA
jgi:hypothetical protein